MIAQAFAKLPEPEITARSVFTHPDFLMLAGLCFGMAVVGGIVCGIVWRALERREDRRDRRSLHIRRF